jgi:hypothetical protein
MGKPLDMPAGFHKRIHRALRAYHGGPTEDALVDLLLAEKIATRQEMATPRLISNQILLDGLDCLKQSDEEAADLLQRRFPNQETALEVAHRRNLTEDIVFQRQREAIKGLARAIWAHEMELRRQRAKQIDARLEPATYSQLFGVAEKMDEIRTLLESASAPWLIALEGMGGVGKTSLVDALVRDLACQVHFKEIGWLSARRRLFKLPNGIEASENEPDFTLAELVDRLIDQFELGGLRHRSDAEKLAGLKDFLKGQPCLIVMDNLETAADYSSLVLHLRGLANPSKFLITTRYSLGDVSGVYCTTLRELSRDDTLDLIRHEAETRGLHELADALEQELAQIYDITGGNPLATKLIIGQIHTLSLPRALTLFKAGKGKAVEELLANLYTNAWQALDQDSRHVLQAMLLVAEEGGQLEQIAAAAELDEAGAASCLQHLATLSLVNVGGDLQKRRYSLHQLTMTFLAQQSGADA